ncbi:MAG: hypothetical protein KF816_05455 [Melioribacteraceae bacterium]|nr:hypothetical protein [Melioribacteraceae bacterium]
MNIFDNITINISGSLLLVILSIIVLLLYSYFIYKFTIPALSNVLRYTLIAIRFICLAFILLLLFEPSFGVTTSDTIKKNTFIFTDNSNSIALSDSLKNISILNNLSNELKTISKDQYIFGDQVDSLREGNESNLLLNDQRTNFSKLFDFLKSNEKQISSAVIISDGIITDGSDPTIFADRFSFPIYTVGIGDSIVKHDVAIIGINFNKYIYSNKKSEIRATIKNTFPRQVNVKASLYDGAKEISSKNIVLSAETVSNIEFDYTSINVGERKLELRLSSFTKEYSYLNNQETFFIDVLESKLKVGIVAGVPSSDLTAVISALSNNQELEISKLISISSNRFLNNRNSSLIDSSDVLVLVNFPSNNSPLELINKVILLHQQKNKPILFFYSPNIDSRRFEIMRQIVPFNLDPKNLNEINVLPATTTNSTNILSSQISKAEIINGLPPLSHPGLALTIKPGASTILEGTSKFSASGVPLIVSSSLGNKRVISILGYETWQWKLQVAEKLPDFFDSLMNDLIKWLSVSSNKKLLSVRTDSKKYYPGEEIRIEAQLYNQSFTPVTDAEVVAEIINKDGIKTVKLNHTVNGFYTGTTSLELRGDYRIIARSKLSGNNIESSLFNFLIEDLSLEKIETVINKNLLKQIADKSGGQYFEIDKTSGLIDLVKSLTKDSEIVETKYSEFKIASNFYWLLLIILLFGIEWFVRKRNGLL